ncbi:MAG TPA: hypothetical protein VFX53_05110 [Pedococcus sp.]|nr:hypothetical protein [Pedococcus sp.]
MATTIERVRVLHGHTSEDTAYHVGDYPYGRVLRCQIRYWIETSHKGAQKGRQRFISQTTNPKAPGTVWNKPKGSTYTDLVVMYLDSNNHVQWHGVHFHLDPVWDAQTRLMGIYDQYTDAQRTLYNALLGISRKYARQWEEWEERVTAIMAHIDSTGTDPEIVNSTWQVPGGRLYYLSTPHVFVAEARRRLAEKTA